MDTIKSEYQEVIDEIKALADQVVDYQDEVIKILKDYNNLLLEMKNATIKMTDTTKGKEIPENKHKKVLNNDGHWDGEIWCNDIFTWSTEDNKCKNCGAQLEED